MINNKKNISVVFISKKSLKRQNNHKHFLRVSNRLRNRFFMNPPSASLFERSSQDLVSNTSVKFVKAKHLNTGFLNNNSLELNRTMSLLKVSSVFNKFVQSNSVSENFKNKENLNGNFFPSKKAFIHYWIFPFVGFAGYIYLNKYNSNLSFVSSNIKSKDQTVNLQSFEKTKIEKEFRLSNLQNSLINSESLMSKVLQNEKKELKTTFFITNFLNNIEKTNNLNKQLLHHTTFVLGHSRKQFLTNQIPQKLVPIYKTNKLELSKNNMNFSFNYENPNFSNDPSYSYFKATKLIDEINQKVLLSQTLTSFNLQITSQRLNNNKQYLNSELIKQVNQILKISIHLQSKQDKSLYFEKKTDLFRQKSIVKNTKKFSNLLYGLNPLSEQNKVTLNSSDFPISVKTNSQVLKNNFHALFLVKYLLKKIEHKHFVNKKLVLANTEKIQILKFKNQKKNKINVAQDGKRKSFLTNTNKVEKFWEHNINKKKLSFKMQDFLITLNKIQTRDNLEFINKYKNTFPLLSETFNKLETTNLDNSSKNEFTQYNMPLNNLKWNFYELATLKFLKYFVNPTVKNVSNNVYKLDKSDLLTDFLKNNSLKYTKLSSILKTLNTNKNSNIVKSLPSNINLNTNKILYYQNLVPRCFSLSLNEKFSSTDFLDLKNSLLLGRNLQNTMSYSLAKIKTPESFSPISIFAPVSTSEELKNENWFQINGEFFLNNLPFFDKNKKFMPNNFITKGFVNFQDQNNNFFSFREAIADAFPLEKDWNFYLKNKKLNLEKFNSPTFFRSKLLFKYGEGISGERPTSFLYLPSFSEKRKNKQFFHLRLKQKKQYKKNYPLYLKNLGHRSQEKIFRAYLSNKYNENNIKTNTFLNYFYAQKTLKKLKKRFFSITGNKKSNFLFITETKFKSRKTHLNFVTQNKNTDIFNFNYPAYQQRYSPNTLLRKLGLLFKYKTELMSKETWDRVEKHRSIQKKRRRKKQKRFYPRPLWLRFLLYRNFLTSRHYYSEQNAMQTQNNYQKETRKTTLQEQKNLQTNRNSVNTIKYWTNKQFVKKIFRKNKKNQVLQQKYTNSLQTFDNQLNYEKIILNKTSKILNSSSGKNNIFHNQDYYQISNEVISDFQKLCWKSYWLRSSLTPYIRRIQKSMQTIRTIETQSFHLDNFVHNSNLLTSSELVNLKIKDKQNLNELNWYLNFKNAANLNPEISTFADFKNFQNRSEYERVLYDRISDIIENVKANLDGSGQIRAKAFKVGRTKKDNLNLRRAFSMSPNQSGSQRKLSQYSENSFSSRFGLFINNNLNTPNINAFSLQSFMDPSIKPFGDLPTLRNFWALNRTHALTGLAQSKTNTGQPDKPQLKQVTETKTLWSVLKFREQNVSNKTKKFFSLVWKKLILMPFTYQSLNNLEKISLKKMEVANKKLNYLGVYLKSNKSIFKYWKMNVPFLKSRKSSQILKHYGQEKVKSIQKTNTITNLQSQKQATRSIQFWWSFPLEKENQFAFYSATGSLFPFSFGKEEKMNQQVTPACHTFFLFLTTLGGCTVLFHLCSLYSFFQSSQIRSLAKFYILLLYKFSNTYLILVYAIFNFIKNYFKQLSQILSALQNAKNRNTVNNNFLAMSKYCVSFGTEREKEVSFGESFNRFLTVDQNQNVNSLNRISLNPVNVDLLKTQNTTLDKNLSLKRNQLFFYGSLVQNVKSSFKGYKHFYLLNNFKNLKMTADKNLNKETLLQNDFKNKVILKLLNLEAFKVRFFLNQKNELVLKTNAVHNFSVTTPKSPQFSILEMCFYSPNLKIKNSLLNQLNQNPSLSFNPSLSSKNKQSQTQDSFFEVNRNFVYSSPKNLKNFISYIITNSQKQKFTSRFYFKKDLLMTKKSLVFSFHKGFQNFYSKVWVGLLFLTKASVFVVYNALGFGSLILFKIIDVLESLTMLIYKFLEKPAEFMVEWIAQLFLVEWSSDITSFVPESFDIYTWRSFTKLSRGSRIFSVFGFLMQRRLWCLFEIYLNLLSKPDADLLNRQKKGIIFWDVWAEILITAAEKYRINLSSLTTVKEEQELFLERLLNDPSWLSSWQFNSLASSSFENKQQQFYISTVKKASKQTRALAELELLAIAGNRPDSLLGTQSFFMKEARTRSISFGNSQATADWFRFSVKTATELLKKGFQNSQATNFNSNLNQNFKSSFKYNLNFVNNNFYDQSTKLKIKNPSLYFNVKQSTSLPSFTFKNDSLYFVSEFNLNWKTWQRWSTNQHFTSQGSDTDLFIDVHPPKSFAQLSQLKSSQSGIASGISGLPTLGSLTCIIYSGLFSKQVSKNILIVGSPGNGQTMLIQALAGETELKMIADNAHRYAHIQRGIAVGMKLLRDVFDGLALHTPCLFLMEDIHVIGERRPMLISDNENVKAAESSFAAENEEVHEKNMFIYQLNKHAITDFRKPYKGDFSLLIPTNHFCFDLFLGVSPPKIRKNGKTTRSPFALETKFYEKQKDSQFADQQNKSTTIVLKTLLQKNSEQFFAPPATSPFNILGMKEQREFKPKQIAKEMPWGGFSNDQIMLLPKATYSIRVKIALLADLAMNQLSVKLDMITDLLVIMDNVRSNRGFVVFATTHVPFVLDPALRRPGRLDETISLPFAPTLIDRFEILKTSLLNYTTTFDFMSYSFLLQNYTETDLSNFISRTKLLLFNNLNDNSQKLNQNYVSFSQENQISTRKYKLDQTTISSLTTALNFMAQLEVTEPKKLYQRIQKAKQKLKYSVSVVKNDEQLSKTSQQFNKLQVNDFSISKNEQKSILEFLKVSKIRSSVSASPSTLVSITYSQIAKFIIGSQVLKDNRVFRNIVPSFEEAIEDGEPTVFRNLYSSSVDIQNTLLYLLSGKAGEFFFFNLLKLLKNNNTSSKTKLSDYSLNNFLLKSSLVNPQFNVGLWNVSTPLSQTNFTKNQSATLANNQTGVSPQVEELCSSATSFVYALVQKRYLYHNTLLINRLLYFNDISMLKEPPSPPGSAILMTAKKYENLKRTERDFQQKPSYSILEKIMLHQQQRFMKKLYERPVLEIFKSEMVQNRYTSFNSSIKELGYYDSFMRKPSSSQSFYKNRILTRHKFSFINQWWNGQLAEHNLESTFSSDVDWRSMFVETFGDLVIDFPDADQHYNPKSRRWFLQSTYGGYWNSFEKTISFEIYQHYIIICFNKAINYLHTEREILDSLAYTYLQKGSFKELDLLTNLSMFNASFDI